MNLSCTANKISVLSFANHISYLQFAKLRWLSILYLKIRRIVHTVLKVEAPRIYLLVTSQQVASIVKKTNRFCNSTNFNPFIQVLFLVGIKIVKPIFIGDNCRKKVIEVYVYRILTLLVQLLFQSTEFLQPFAFVMLSSNNVAISNIDLEGILVLELDGLIDKLIYTSILVFSISIEELLRKESTFDNRCFWQILCLSNFLDIYSDLGQLF